MSQYDTYEKSLDPTPRTLKKSGPFTDQLKTLANAVRFAESKGLSLDEVKLAHNYVMWEETETPEEVQARIERNKGYRQKHLDAIARMHAEYTERGLYDG